MSRLEIPHERIAKRLGGNPKNNIQLFGQNARISIMAKSRFIQGAYPFLSGRKARRKPMFIITLRL